MFCFRNKPVTAILNKLCRRPPQYAPALFKLTFDLLTLKVVSKSRVTWATSVPILVFLGLSVLDLGPMYATDRRQTDVRRASSLNAPPPYGRGFAGGRHNMPPPSSRRTDTGRQQRPRLRIASRGNKRKKIVSAVVYHTFR